MTAPDEGGMCSVCTEVPASGSLPPHDSRCAGRMCSDCVENLVRHSCEPTVISTASADDFEWGQLPASVSCPFCRAPLSRPWLESIAVPDDVLDVAFALNRSTYYYRYAGEQWQGFADDPFAGEVALLPVLDPARTRGTLSDTTFMPAVNSSLGKAVTEYNALLSAVRGALRASSLPPESIAGHIVDFDDVTARIMLPCAARATVLAVLTNASLSDAADVFTEDIPAVRALCERMTDACFDLVTAGAGSGIRRPQLEVPDLLPWLDLLGVHSLWFALVEDLVKVHAAIEPIWSRLRGVGSEWATAPAQTWALDALSDLDHITALCVPEEVRNVDAWAELLTEENKYLLDHVGAARTVLGLGPVQGLAAHVG
ncbi:hypothetical protein [Lentzea sp. E54]|uniref:hypothetical protein n=1 Tax=Lentzea xerophila TaxID=3435883 RepID=UPI003DA5096B